MTTAPGRQRCASNWTAAWWATRGSSTGDPGLPAWTTPTFLWERVDGAAGYRLQVDDDSNFSTPLINKNVDAISYTPTTVFGDGTYYWRVAMRRSDTVFGHWTPTMSFVKSSRPPQVLKPAPDEIVNEQPSFIWTAVLTPTVTPRLAAPRYRLQISSDPNFSANLKTIDTDSASYTLKKAESLADGYWYWRVAVLQDAVVQARRLQFGPALLQGVPVTGPDQPGAGQQHVEESAV